MHLGKGWSQDALTEDALCENWRQQAYSCLKENGNWRLDSKVSPRNVFAKWLLHILFFKQGWERKNNDEHDETSSQDWNHHQQPSHPSIQMGGRGFPDQAPEYNNVSYHIQKLRLNLKLPDIWRRQNGGIELIRDSALRSGPKYVLRTTWRANHRG